ncbi:lysozyme [Burkholderia pseudomallei]|nr:lysozyme [Burkholderia pseudomallei]KGD49392.1 lysozyme [Burkholderia pseudomallei]
MPALRAPFRFGESETMTQIEKNREAFLTMIRVSEGTAATEGYRTLFGGELFSGFTDHPRRIVTRTMNGRSISSSAAGAYQFLKRTWDEIAMRLDLPDFSPKSQDAAALELIRAAGALGDVDAGQFALAVHKVRRIWASLPGAGYGQPEQNLEQLQAAYQAAGGVING